MSGDGKLGSLMKKTRKARNRLWPGMHRHRCRRIRKKWECGVKEYTWLEIHLLPLMFKNWFK